jgi:hypothetical protein
VFSAVGATNTQTLTINLTVVTAASLVTTYRGRNLPIGMTATVPQSIGDRTTLATPFGGTVWDTADLSVGSARYNAATVLVAVSYAQLMTHLATVAANDLDYIITTPVATLVGVVTLPAKTYPNRHCWIVNTTIHAGTFAHAIGTKVPKSTVGMTILQGPPSAIDAVVEYAQSGNARGYSLHGIVVQIDPSSASYYVQLGIISCRRNTPQVAMSGYSGRLKIDRCWIRGSAIADVRRGILMSGPYLDMQDSRISDVHYRGNESAGIGGWTGAQLHKQINCTIEAGAQTILYGGADPDNPNTNLLDPSDIYTERVYGFKPLTWLTTHPSYAGIHWTVKTGFEAKNVRRWLIDRSWTQNCWPDAQTGFAMLFQNLSDDNSNHLENRIEDVIVRNHKFDYVAMGMNSLSRVAYGGGVTPTHRMTRICYDNILLTRVGGNRADPDSIILNGLSQALGRELQVLGDIDGILIDRITSDGRILFLFSSPGANGQLTNIVGRAGQYGAFLDGGQTGSTAIASYFSDGLVVDGNVAYDISEGILNAGWDGDETNSSMAFQDYDNYNYRLTTQHLNKGVGGSIPGCDIDTLETELSGINT